MQFLEILRNLLLVEFLKNFKPQKNNEGIALGDKIMGESFFPIPDKILSISEGEFHGMD